MKKKRRNAAPNVGGGVRCGAQPLEVEPRLSTGGHNSPSSVAGSNRWTNASCSILHAHAEALDGRTRKDGGTARHGSRREMAGNDGSDVPAHCGSAGTGNGPPEGGGSGPGWWCSSATGPPPPPTAPTAIAGPATIAGCAMPDAAPLATAGSAAT